MDAFLLGLAEEDSRLVKMQPWPKRWADFHAKHQLVWTHFQFAPSSANVIPTVPGLYCFFVGQPPASLPPVGYPMYVGKTERTLRIRFGEYLREQNDPGGRVRVRKFLNVFEGELYFSCTPFNGTAAQVKEVETDLHNALMPAYSDIGYSAEVRQKRQAWQ